MASKARELANLGNAYSDGALSNRNMIINGAMQVWQRGTSRAFSTTQYVTVDRFQPGIFQSAGYERTTVSGAGPDAQYALRVTSSNTSEAASGTRMAAGQMIESVNCQPVIGKQVTLSFWVKFSAATFANYGNFQYTVAEYDAVNPSFSSTVPSRSTVKTITNGSLPTGWIKFSLTVTINAATNTIAPRFFFTSLANTANNSDLFYDITEVQLEAGDTATPFEHRSYGQELALCERYYQTLVLPARYVGGSSGPNVRFGFTFSEMRASPTCTLNATFANNYVPTGNELVIWGLGATSRAAPTAVSISAYGKKSLMFDLSAPLVSAVAYELGVSLTESAASILMSAEL